jgi:hypothetical protein
MGEFIYMKVLILNHINKFTSNVSLHYELRLFLFVRII